jgi:hypothetical protein
MIICGKPKEKQFADPSRGLTCSWPIPIDLMPLFCLLITSHTIIFSSLYQVWFQIYFKPRFQSSGDDALHSHYLRYFILSILFTETSLRPFRSSWNDVKIESHEKCHSPLLELTAVLPIERGLSKFCGIVPADWNFLSGHWDFTTEFEHFNFLKWHVNLSDSVEKPIALSWLSEGDDEVFISFWYGKSSWILLTAFHLCWTAQKVDLWIGLVRRDFGIPVSVSQTLGSCSHPNAPRSQSLWATVPAAYSWMKCKCNEIGINDCSFPSYSFIHRLWSIMILNLLLPPATKRPSFVQLRSGQIWNGLVASAIGAALAILSNFCERSWPCEMIAL